MQFFSHLADDGRRSVSCSSVGQSHIVFGVEYVYFHIGTKVRNNLEGSVFSCTFVRMLYWK